MCWRRHERDEHGRRCVRDVRNEVLLRLGHCFPLPPQRVDIGHHRRDSGTCASRMIDDRFFDFSVCLSLRARPQSPSVFISSQLPGKHDSFWQRRVSCRGCSRSGGRGEIPGSAKANSGDTT